MNEEEKYKQFWAKFSRSITELQNDFNNMSDSNKLRIKSDIQNTLVSYGIVGSVDNILRMLNQIGLR